MERQFQHIGGHGYGRLWHHRIMVCRNCDKREPTKFNYELLCRVEGKIWDKEKNLPPTCHRPKADTHFFLVLCG